MASSLEKKQIDELLAKQQAIAVRAQRRVDELEQRNAHLLEQITSSIAAPATAFGVAYARAYFGDEASSIGGVPIDAVVGLGLHALAACVGLSLDKDSQSAATILHSFANGALASWTASLGAELGAQKRLERPAPPPPPNPGEEVTPVRTPRPMTRAELYEAVAATRSMTQLSMPEQPPVPLPRPHAPPPAPFPSPVQQKANPLPTAEPVAAQALAPPAPLPRPHAPPPAPLSPPVQQMANPLPRAEPVAAQARAPTPSPPSTTPPPPSLNERATPVAPSAKSEASPAPCTPHTASGDSNPWVLDPQAEMRALLQSYGAPSDPKTVAYVLMHENSIDAYRQVVGRVRAPAAARSIAQKPNRVTKPWELDPEAEMSRLLQSRGAPSDPRAVEYVLTHENPIEAFRVIVSGAQVPTTKGAPAKVPTPAPVPQSSTPPQTSLNAPPTIKKKPRRSLAAARTVGITEAAVVPSPQMPPKSNPMELPKQLVQESNHSVQLTQEELEAAERWRLLRAA